MTTLIKVLDTGLLSVYTVRDADEQIRKLLPCKYTAVYQEYPYGDVSIFETNYITRSQFMIYSGIIFVVDDVVTLKELNLYKDREIKLSNIRRLNKRNTLISKQRAVLIKIYPNSIEYGKKELHPRVVQCRHEDEFMFKYNVIQYIPDMIKKYLYKCSNDEYHLVNFIYDILHMHGNNIIGKICRFPAIIDESLCNSKYDISQSVTIYYDMILNGSYDDVTREELEISTMIEMINTPDNKMVSITCKSVIDKIKSKINAKYYKLNKGVLTIKYIYIMQADITFTISELLTLN